MSCMINSLVMKPSTTMSSSYGCSIFFPVTKSFSSNPSFSIQIKPIKPNLISCSSLSPFPFSLTAIEKKTRCPSLISFVAKNNNALLEEEEEDNLDDQEWENEEEDNLDDQECEEEEEEEEIVSNTEEEWVPSEDCKIFVGNMPYDINSSQLAGLFQDAGIVERAEVIYNKDTDQSRGFGFVSMHTVEEAERAVQMLNGYELNGRLLTVNKAGARGTRPERPQRPERQSRVFNPTNRIYVGNLPWGVDDAGLTEIFSKHGKVLNARVVRDIESDKSRGFGFVTMSTKSELNDAISNLDGQILNGRPIVVNVAEERKPRSF